MKNLKQPTNQTEEILFFLLKREIITFKQIYWDTGILNLSARLSDLRAMGLNIPCELIKTTNKFGRNITYGSWKLTDKDKGLKVYNELLKQ